MGFACGLAGGTTCVFVTNPLISTTTEEKRRKEKTCSKQREKSLKSSFRPYRDLRKPSRVETQGSFSTLDQVYPCAKRSFFLSVARIPNSGGGGHLKGMNLPHLLFLEEFSSNIGPKS
jgi:hypothetical protein